MKSLILLIVVVGTLISCSAPNKQPSKVLVSELDTFYLGGKLINVEKVAPSEFDKLPFQAFDSHSESINILKDSSLVKRIGDTLILNILGNKNVKLINVKNTDTLGDNNGIQYSYLGFNGEIGQYIIKDARYTLIDAKTGDKTYTNDIPQLAPNRSFFICGASAAEYFEETSIAFYKNTHKPILIGNRNLKKWTPSEFRFVNDTAIVVKATVWDSTKNDDRTDYFKLHWKQE